MPTDREIAEQIAELRKLLDKTIPNTGTKEQFNWLAGWRAKILNALPAFLDLAAASLSAGEPDGMETTADTSNEVCAVACMLVSDPQGQVRQPGWQKRVNDLIRALCDERNSLLAREAKAREEERNAIAHRFEHMTTSPMTPATVAHIIREEYLGG